MFCQPSKYHLKFMLKITYDWESHPKALRSPFNVKGDVLLPGSCIHDMVDSKSHSKSYFTLDR